MLTTLALAISFVLWKVSMLAVLAVIFGIIFIVFWLLSYDEEGFMNYTLNVKRFKVMMGVAFVLSIPWWNLIHDTSMTKAICKPLMNSWEEHIKKNEPVVRINEKTEIRRYELISWNPPKHFYVTLEDVQTHDVHNQVYVSKHCNSHHNLKKGDEFNVQITRYAMSDNPSKELMEFNNLYSTFCGE